MKPSLGITAQEIYRNWEQARVVGFNVAGLLIGVGRFFWRGGELYRALSPANGYPASYEKCTQDELAEIDRAIQNGWLQIVAEPPTGLVYGKGTLRNTPDPYDQGIWVLHQATGRPLEQEAA